MGDEPQSYLDELEAPEREALLRVNRAGVTNLRAYLAEGRAVAFLGAGASAPLYPLWEALIGELLDVAAVYLGESGTGELRDIAKVNLDGVADRLREKLGPLVYYEVLRQVLRVRRHPETGRTYTAAHELVARCAFARIVTTNFDPGILAARVAVRPDISPSGYASYTNEDALDRWTSDDILRDAELPVLFAHGHHDVPQSVVLATTEYRSAYRGKLGRVLRHLVESGHIIWLGFSFSDQRILSIINEVADASGTSAEPGLAPRHVAVMGWDPTKQSNAGHPEDIRRIMQAKHGCDVVLYPAPSGDHSALSALLAEFTDSRFPPVPIRLKAGQSTVLAPPPNTTVGPDPVLEWVHGCEPAEHFTGRGDELARLDRWADDPEVQLIGVTAWGGAGKTALVTEWLLRRGGAQRRDSRGVFTWSFYQENSAQRWAESLLEWAEREIGIIVTGGRLAARLLDLLAVAPLVVVLDGLEVMQESRQGGEGGRLLDGLLREVLVGHCQHGGRSLLVLTSRFPFADVERFSGSSARMLDVLPFTPSEGASLLSLSGARWLPESERRALSIEVDGHALAISVLASVLAGRPPAHELSALRSSVASTATTNERVAKVLSFYADHLSEPDRLLVARVSLFQRPVAVETILALSVNEPRSTAETAWTAAGIMTAVRTRLAGLLIWHSDGHVSAHPLVRDSFRPLVLSPGVVSLATTLALADLPGTAVQNHSEALRVVEMVELLLDADQWDAANELHRSRTDNSRVFLDLPAARLGQRAAGAFVGLPALQHLCRSRLSDDDCRFYLNDMGLFTTQLGDPSTAIEYIEAGNAISKAMGDNTNHALGLENLAECHIWLGLPEQAAVAARDARNLMTSFPNRIRMGEILAYLATAYDLAGRSRDADQSFLAAALDLARASTGGVTNYTGVEIAWHSTNRPPLNLYSSPGTNWADFLIRTGRVAIARRLTQDNRTFCYERGWNEHVARCDRVLACCDLAEGNPHGAGARLETAVATFRDGDLVLQVVASLPELAEQRRQSGRLDAAEQACREAIALARDHNLVAAHAKALTVRARVRGDLAQAEGRHTKLDDARDDANSALRLATQLRQLPWQELQALDAHAYLDDLAAADDGWRHRANELRIKLIPPSVSQNPF